MKLSVIIVNYNVRYFLSSCLQSALIGAKKVPTEIIVVDNNSTDGSVEMLQREYRHLTLILNKDNRGFSRANNQGMAVSKGEYMLLLNPDTIVEEDCFLKCVEYMDAHPKAGGLGVKMIDGAGTFLPESKRGLPTPAVSFYKIFGLARLFPKSKRFGAYHLGFLDNDQTHNVDVLSGAFMMLRKSLIDEIGGLDESFFMYGEDIDLSYRITKAGYNNVYFPETRIIHFKGESTKKSSVNYVLVFYRAMIIFANKHFSFPNARLLSFLINSAIYFRASLALFQRFTKSVYMPLIDMGMMYGFLMGLKYVYEREIMDVESYFPESVTDVAFPIMAGIWVLGQLITGGYRQPVMRVDTLKGLTVSGIVLLGIYAMTDESFRFSRVVVGSALLGSFIVIPVSRLLLQSICLFKLDRSAEQRIAIIGKPESAEKISRLLKASTERPKKFYYINPEVKSQSSGGEHPDYLASLYQLRDAIGIYRLNEVVFSMNDITTARLIEEMQKPYLKKVNIFLSPPTGNYLLRSSSNKDLGEYIIPESRPEMTRWMQRKKRGFEMVTAVAMLVLSPILLFLFRRPGLFLSNMFSVMTGRLRLIGVPGLSDSRPAVIRPFSNPENISKETRDPAITDYLVHYSVRKDVQILLRNLSLLDSKAISDI